MPKAPQTPVENRLLAALPRKEYERLLPKLENASLSYKESLYEADKPIEYVYFINSGVVSLIVIMEGGAIVEVGTIGNEGMVGISVFLGANTIPGKAIVQVPGDGMRMKSGTLRNEAKNGGPLHNVLRRYTQALLNQIAQSAACNRTHSIEQRCARWLLMTHDSVRSDEFLLTQEFLSLMLGVRRPSVSTVANKLQKAGLIRYSRGRITIVDRQGLESVSCECYRIIKEEYDRLLN
jgi:CRP-like cAMP-binding protein